MCLETRLERAISCSRLAHIADQALLGQHLLLMGRARHKNLANHAPTAMLSRGTVMSHEHQLDMSTSGIRQPMKFYLQSLLDHVQGSSDGVAGEGSSHAGKRKDMRALVLLVSRPQPDLGPLIGRKVGSMGWAAQQAQDVGWQASGLLYAGR